MLAAYLLLAAAAQAPAVTADRAGNRMERLSLSATARLGCTAKQDWCVRMEPASDDDGAWQIRLQGGPRVDARPLAAHRFAAAGASKVEPAPYLFRLADGGALIGVLATRSEGYSGGGAGSTHLHFVHVAPPARGPRRTREVLQVAASGWAMIRACFGEADMKKRANACHDEYKMEGQLRLDPATRKGWPAFLYTLKARRFPAGVSRAEDSLARPPLGKSDLRWEADKHCAGTFRFTFDAASGSYEAARALPECSDYFPIDD